MPASGPEPTHSPPGHSVAGVFLGAVAGGAIVVWLVALGLYIAGAAASLSAGADRALFAGSMDVSELAVAATIVWLQLLVDHRRRVRDVALRDEMRVYLDEWAARAEARHQALLEKVEQVAAESLEKASDHARWLEIADDLKRHFGLNGNAVVPMQPRRNGSPRPTA